MKIYWSSYPPPAVSHPTLDTEASRRPSWITIILAATIYHQPSGEYRVRRCTFIAEIVAFRWGTAKLAEIGIVYDPRRHGAGGHSVHDPEGGGPYNNQITAAVEEKSSLSQVCMMIKRIHPSHKSLVWPVLIGLTLAADPDFKILFIVIVFHQTFEGLGLGSHLAYMQLAPAYRDIPIWGALLYGITTPVGVAAGLGVRTTYSPDSTTASIVSGVMDALSADILIYTIMVELIAHEILLNREMQFVVSNWKLARSVMMLISGCGIMALLAKWA